MIGRLYRQLLQNTFRAETGDLADCVLPNGALARKVQSFRFGSMSSSIPERSPVNIPLRKTEKRRLDKLHRRLLPFYMKPLHLDYFHGNCRWWDS